MTADLMARMSFYQEMLKRKEFSPGALAIAFVLLYRHLNGRTGRCDPSISTLANGTGLTKRTVYSAVNELRKSEWWQVARAGETGRGGRTNLYTPQFEVGRRSGELPNTSSIREVVKRRTPVRAESGEVQRQKVVKRASPKPVKNQNQMVDLHRPFASAARSHWRVSDIGNRANREFETFWQVYPSRRPHSNPKKPARLKFETAISRGADPADIIRGAENYRAIVEATGTDARYVAQAQTWLSQERWNDHSDAEPPRLRVGMN
jgi:hypothetical protein